MITGTIGEQHSRLTLVEVLAVRRGKRVMGRWRCLCGNSTDAPITRVRSGAKKSCGCLTHDTKPNLSHGMRGTPEYTSWQSMLRRCHNPTDKDYPRWGGNGITVCDEWRASFEAFYAHIGPRPPGTTLDRIDGTDIYRPGNVRWATPREQMQNRADYVIVETPQGRMGLAEYAALIGITRGAAHLRLKRGTLDGCVRAGN